MPGSKPPFRADHVGSLLRPPALVEVMVGTDTEVSPWEFIHYARRP